MAINTIIFDLGNVLIDWNPKYVFDKMFEDEEKKKYFFENVCTMEWNEMQDAGRPIKEATEELLEKHPEWSYYIEAYYGKWKEMLGGAIHETVEIFRELKQSGRYKLFALTNWSAELFPYALATYEFLHWFDGRLVSGEEKIRKPMPEIYQLLIRRFGFDPKRAIYVDDNLRNVGPAREEGFYGIHFRSPEQFRAELVELGVL